jgi:acetoin utilization protein AcuC
MSGKPGFLWDPRHARYFFGPEHPLHPIRLELTFDLIRTLELLSPLDVLTPTPARDEDLLLVHTPEYVAAVRSARPDRPDAGLLRFGLGTADNPVFEDMHEASSLAAGASLQGAELVATGKLDHALNLAGGLHHAQAATASGFCIYNDPAVAIAHLRRRHGCRVAYVDIDAHHGDGVQWAFYYDPDVLTISLHETGRFLFPGTGFVNERGAGPGYGYAVNVPLEPFTDDSSWQEAFLSVVPPLVRRFRPDVIVSQHGCDGHRLDPLAHLALTTESYELAARTLHALAHELCGGRWLALGGGGYDWRVVPRVWTLLWAEIAGLQVPTTIPAAWIQRWQDRCPYPLPTTLRDDPAAFPPIMRRDDIAERNRRTVTLVLEGLPPALKP